jgi:BRCA1-associated protein
MPAYFYHLSFELFHPSSTEASGVTQPDSGNASYRSHTASVQEKAPHGREQTADPGFKQRLRDVLPEADAILVSPPPPPPLPEAQLSPPLPPADWRYGLISVESFTMAPLAASIRRSTTAAAQNPPSQRPPAGGSTSAAISEEGGGGAGGGSVGGVGGGGASAATKGRFISLTPENADLGWGIVHLYRDSAQTPELYDDDSWKTPGLASSGVGSGAARTSPPRHHRRGHQQQSQQSQQSQQQQQQQWNEEDCTTLCILAVPSYLTPFDLLGYVGEKTIKEVTHIRMIRTERVNRYMVLLKFRSATTARQWRKEWNGKPFNSVEVSSSAYRERDKNGVYEVGEEKFI